jgi:hypothetical protein
MTGPTGVETRAAALLRSRAAPIAITAGGGLLLTALLTLVLEPDRAAGPVGMVTASLTLLVPMIVAHGMISGDLRSGSALLWLQKPVHPVGFYLVRGVEVTALAILLLLVLSGGCALIVSLAAELPAGAEILREIPFRLLMATCLCAMVFAFSAWGVQMDTLFALVYFIVTVFSTALAGPLAQGLAWTVVPVNEMQSVSSALLGSPGEGVGRAAFVIGRFLLIWGLFGAAGLGVSTRSPIPSEPTR